MILSKFSSFAKKGSMKIVQSTDKERLFTTSNSNFRIFDVLTGINEKDQQENFHKFKRDLLRAEGYGILPKTTLNDDEYTKKLEDPATPPVLKVLMKNYREWIFKLSNEEIKNIRHYTNSGYELLNDHLNGNSSSDKSIRDFMNGFGNKLHSSLSKAIITEKIKVYHRNNQTILRNLNFKEAVDLKGQELLVKGFLSTSLDLNSCVKLPHHNLTMSINVPKGAKGAYIADISAYKAENEILFDRNQVLKIKSAKLFFGEIYMQCEMKEKKV